MSPRPSILRRALFVATLVLTALPALAFLELPNATQIAFNDILAAVDSVEEPSAKQRLAQLRVGKSTSKLFREGRTLRQCLKDMDKTLRRAGSFFEDAEADGSSVPELRARLLDRLIDDVFAAAVHVEEQILESSSDTNEARTQKALKPVAKAKDRLIELSEALFGSDQLDAKALRQAFRALGQNVELLDRAARRAKKAKLGSIAVAVPPANG